MSFTEWLVATINIWIPPLVWPVAALILLWTLLKGIFLLIRFAVTSVLTGVGLLRRSHGG